MSIILNDPGCTTLGANTGQPSCALIPKNIIGALLIDKDKVFSGADIATTAAWITAVQTLCLGPLSTRAYPIFAFDGVEDETEDTTYKTLGYGSEIPNKEGKYKMTFDISRQGHYFAQQLRKFKNDHSKKVIFFTSDQQVLAVKSGTAGNFTGFSMDYIYAKPVKLDDGGENPATYKVKFCLSKPIEMNDDLAMFDLGADPESTFKAILDVKLSVLAQDNAGVTVGVKIVGDNVNMFDAFSTKLADLTLWTVTKAGAAVTPTGITADATLKGWKIALTTPAGEHVVTLASAAELAAKTVGGAPDEGYEADGSLTVTFA